MSDDSYIQMKNAIYYSKMNAHIEAFTTTDWAGGQMIMNEGEDKIISGPDLRTLDGVSVLIVEDEPIIAMDEAFLVEEIGMKVAGLAQNGKDAVHTAVVAHPDLILMDIDLGDGIDGIQAAELIREQYPAKVVFVTGHLTEDSRILEARQLPNTWLVKKPFNEQKLECVIRNILSDETRSSVINTITMVG